MCPTVQCKMPMLSCSPGQLVKANVYVLQHWSSLLTLDLLAEMQETLVELNTSFQLPAQAWFKCRPRETPHVFGLSGYALLLYALSFLLTYKC